MKTLLALLVVSLFVSGCATRVVTPLPPTNSDFKSSYRKTVEVLVIECQSVKQPHYRAHRGQDSKTIVESTSTGERFEVWGCYGSRGDRFRISY
jgi:hypothetical protein